MPHPTFVPSQESSEWFQGTPPSPLKSGLAGRMLVSHLNPRSCSLSWQNNPNQTAHQCLFNWRFYPNCAYWPFKNRSFVLTGTQGKFLSEWAGDERRMPSGRGSGRFERNPLEYL